jgi:hypothetical protein
VKEVAAALGLSPRDGRTHKYQAVQALGLKTIVELICHAVEQRLITPPHQT